MFRIFVFVLLSVALLAQHALAATVIDFKDALGVWKTGTVFQNGKPVTIDSIVNENTWPTVESPDHAIDDQYNKYLNFAELNAGVIITAETARRPIQMIIWTANDFPERDPTSFELYGSNSTLVRTNGGNVVVACS